MWRKVVLGVVVAAVLGFLLIQLVPYGRDHTDPPVTREVTWSSPAVKELAVRAYNDCHSNKPPGQWYLLVPSAALIY